MPDELSELMELRRLLRGLSDRDRELLRGAGNGMSSKQMARAFGGSPHTIDDRLKRLRRVLNAVDRAHAGRMFLAFETGRDPLRVWGAQGRSFRRSTLGGRLSPRAAATRARPAGELRMSAVLDWRTEEAAERERRREAGWKAEAEAFQRRFPPMNDDASPDLAVSWAEIERQFLDLSASWDQRRAQTALRELRAMSEVVSAEQVVRWLMIISHTMSTSDTPEPVWTRSRGDIVRLVP